METIRLSSKALCAQEKYCFNLDAKKEHKLNWIKKHDLFVSCDKRVYALVDTESHVFFMDAITGSLYQFGNCLTSDKLSARGLKRNKVLSEQILMSKTADELGIEVKEAV